MRVTVELKIISGFLMVSILFGTVGYFNITNINRIDESHILLDEYHMPALSAINDMNTESANIFSSALKFEFAKNELESTAETKEKIIKEGALMQEGKRRFGEALQKYAAITEKHGLPDEKNFAEIISKKWDAFSEALDKFIIAKNGGASHKAILEAKDDLENSRDALSGILKDISDYEESVIRQKKEVSGTIMRNTQISTVLVLALAIISALGAGILISSSVVEPLSDLRRAINAFGKGETVEEIKVASDDEIEELTKSFNEMVREIKYSRDSLESRTNELERSKHELEESFKGLKAVQLRKKINALEEELKKYEGS